MEREVDQVDIVTLDFEASCLPRHGRSFPIEVGIADRSGARSWLIRPHARWDGWDWTASAQALHGLTRAQVAARGLAAADVLDQLVTAIAGRRVVADSRIDQYWLDELAAAAGVPAPFRVDHVATLLDELAVDEAAIAAALAKADGQGHRRHRAAGDAAWLFALIAALDPAGAPPVPVPLAL